MEWRGRHVAERLAELFEFGFAARVNHAEARLHEAAAARDFGRADELSGPLSGRPLSTAE